MSEENNIPQRNKKGQFVKGNSISGRPKGVPNKATAEIKERFTDLVNDNSKKVQEWLDRVAEKDPDKAIDLLGKLSEYVIPKLARTEVKADIESRIQKVNVNINRSKSEDKTIDIEPEEPDTNNNEDSDELPF